MSQLLAWLRQLICQCPEPVPVIENTGYTTGFAHPGNWGVEVPASQLDQLVADDAAWTRPVMQVHVGGDLRVTEPEPAPRHLRVVRDADVPAQQADDPS